ncbi:hypothetical protein [Desulfonatronum sp. SC1]|uniref:hypothetical protein n=1 Tax=Desulfonatronum sp. SC1 TaxID=2109626 RepID=UPI000D3199F4|nr:hypothetical protein [Desulfonatronum sp. SC1]PTN36478.1 hypothetical protein C6366_09145 [Desulfonatronum sp. SC1]
MLETVHAYLTRWQADPKQVRPFFARLLEALHGPETEMEFVERDGVSVSLRAKVSGPDKGAVPKELFCLVDVVEDVDGRWLSVCFYADTVSDPEERGNLVPLGLLGEDGYCFDVEEPDPVLEAYVLERVDEARQCVGAGRRRS